VNDRSRTDLEARPATEAGTKAFVVTPFARLARAHAASTMADAMVATAFAGSLFFSLPADDARWPVLRYLLITMLPFAVLSPLIGPLIDRMKGGHRLVMLGSIVLRSLLCYLLISEIEGAKTVFFLLALCVLVCQKGYQVARSALVPTVVRDDAELMEANSKLSLISGVSGFVGVVPAGILLKLPHFGASWSVGLAMFTYAVAGAIALRIPASQVATAPADETERHELRGATILMAGSAMGLIRACVGFLTLLVAFDFRGGDRPTWAFGLVGGASVLSQLGGAAVAPRLRALTTEENVLTGVLGLLVVGGVLSLVLGDVAGATVLGSCVGFAAGGGKLAFDSIVQRDAPDANRGRAFARFETRFQVTWVIGALIPVWIRLDARVGFGFVLALALVALASYEVARLAYAHRTGSNQNAATAAATVIEDRLNEVSGEVKDRIAAAPRAAFRRLRSGRTEEVEPADGPPPAGADEPETERVDGSTERTRPDRSDTPAGVASRGPDDLAHRSPIAWHPPERADEFPWEPPEEPADAPGSFLADVDPTIHHPYPWTPDDPTRPNR
jgi:hypothetical protein